MSFNNGVNVKVNCFLNREKLTRVINSGLTLKENELMIIITSLGKEKGKLDILGHFLVPNLFISSMSFKSMLITKLGS